MEKKQIGYRDEQIQADFEADNRQEKFYILSKLHSRAKVIPNISQKLISQPKIKKANLFLEPISIKRDLGYKEKLQIVQNILPSAKRIKHTSTPQGRGVQFKHPNRIISKQHNTSVYRFYSFFLSHIE